MSESNNRLRLELDENASRSLKEMMKALKANGNVTVNYSKLCSAIIERYFKNGNFEKEYSQLERMFFNEYKFMLQVLRKREDVREAVKKLPKKEKTLEDQTPSGGLV